jgi:hypothetical protein
MSDKFKMPETREEAVTRKEALLEQINKYNEEYFSGETTLTEEEINLIQEEYQFLDDLVDIEDDFAKGEEEKEKGFLDKVNVFVWVYMMFAIFSGFFFLQEAITLDFLVTEFSNWEWLLDLDLKGQTIVLICCCFLYPVILAIIGLILKLFVFKKNKEDKKVFKYIYYGQLIWLLINFSIFFFINIFPILKW